MKPSKPHAKPLYEQLGRHLYRISAVVISVIVPRRDEKDEDGDGHAPKNDSRVEVIAEDLHRMPGRDLQTRNLLLVGLIIGWGASITAVVAGIHILVSPNVHVPDFLVGKMLMIGPTPFAMDRQPKIRTRTGAVLVTLQWARAFL
ncbi:hypothetical protein B0T14DRAFT_565651 [Immersiella caudata]|uniref:Uncharacterized protein n=1 Tax=Immersiella caudata TaxID=314043 RepID=A0AA39X017_9PEZI|nr:hypothetical protein B0T14DRAFT_565651 [Immersiella caudata]